MASTEHRSFCRICNAMCGIVVTVDDHGAVERVRGDDAHPLSRGYTCPKGRAIGLFHHDPRRLDRPEIRGEPVSWTTALDDIAAVVRNAIETHGPDAVGMYLASGSAFDTNGRRAAERFLRVIGSRQKYTAATIDTPSKPLVAELVGGWSGLTPIWDHERSSLFLLVGSNPLVSHGHSNAMPDPVVRLRDHQANGGELWVIDPRRTETARLADHHLAPVPSTDHLVLAHVVRELLRDGADHEYLAAHTDPADVATLRACVEPCTRDTVARATGVDAADLDALVAAVRRAGRVSGLTGTGVSMGRHANVAEWMLWALHIVTGSYDRPGGMWFNPGYLLQLDQRTWTASDGVPEPGPASRPHLPRRFDEYPCAGLVPEIEAGNLRVLFVVGGNPLCAMPDEARQRAAYAQLDALVVLDVVRTDTTAVATHLLPAAGHSSAPTSRRSSTPISSRSPRSTRRRCSRRGPTAGRCGRPSPTSERASASTCCRGASTRAPPPTRRSSPSSRRRAAAGPTPCSPRARAPCTQGPCSAGSTSACSIRAAGDSRRPRSSSSSPPRSPRSSPTTRPARRSCSSRSVSSGR